MSQQRIQDYGSPVVAQSLKSLIDAITIPGILSGNEFVRDASNRLRINPGSCVTQQGVIIVEDETKIITIDNTSIPVDYTIYYLHEDVQISGGVAAELTKEAGLLTPEVVQGCILGYVRYPGGSIPLEQSHFIQPPLLKLGTVTPTKENAPWFVPIRNLGYLTPDSRKSGATINITDTWADDISLNGALFLNSKIVGNITPSTIGLIAGMEITGNSNIPAGTFIESINTTSQITLTNPATLTVASASFIAVPKTRMYLKLRNNGITTGVVTLTFPFKVSENPFALLQILLSTDINALVTPIFMDSNGEEITLVTVPSGGFTGQSAFLLKSVDIPRTTTQTANTIVYLHLMVALAVGKEVRIQALGLNTYNLPV